MFLQLLMTPKAVQWLKLLDARLSAQRPIFDPRPVYVGFLVDKVALGEVYLPVFRFYAVSIIPLMLRIHSAVTIDPQA
jgi:hypothetical protein